MGLEAVGAYSPYEDGGCPSTASRPAVDGRVVAGPAQDPSKSKGGLMAVSGSPKRW